MQIYKSVLITKPHTASCIYNSDSIIATDPKNQTTAIGFGLVSPGGGVGESNNKYKFDTHLSW